MTVKTDQYQIVLRFSRLFPDPVLFEDPVHLTNRYLTSNGLPREMSELVCQDTNEISPVDDNGKPSSTAGTAKYPFEGHVILAEYMSNANVRIDYTDFGSGLAPTDHSRLWSKGKIGGLRFELREFKHQSQTLNIPDVLELYTMLKNRATPSTMSTIDLDNLPGPVFKSAVAYIERALRNSATRDGLEVEVYAARNLSPSEKTSLEKRLTRESTKNTVFIILSRAINSKPVPTTR